MAIVFPLRSRGRVDFRQFDKAYVDGLCRGEPEVVAHFTAYFGELIWIKLRQRVKSRHMLEDVRQDTFLRVLRILRSEPGVHRPGALGALVNSVCNNVFHEACRSRSYEELPEELGPAVASDALNRLISEEQRQKVQRVLHELPERDRRLLRAVFLDESSREEVCAEFQVDREYLRVLLHRAKESFRALFRRVESSIPPGPSSGPQLRSP